MSLARTFLQRIALGVVAAWGVLTVVFALFSFTRNWNIEQDVAMQQWGGGLSDEEAEAVVQEYLAERDLDRPLHEQYVDWTTSMFTLDWGDSFQTGEAVFPMVVDATWRTAMYVLPAIVVAVALGLALGVYAALHPESRLAGSGVGTAYLLFALPNFYVGGMLLSLAAGGAVPDSSLLFDHALPVALTATSLLGGYVSFTRAHAAEYASAEFVTLVKAKGASRLRVAIHVVRNGAIPMFSMLFTEALALLVLAIFVIEVLFGIEGLGLLLFDAIEARDLPVLLGGTMVVIAVGVVGNIVQDVSYTVLDPRVDTGSR
ncbi:ABC transporter permease [Halovivax sp.]|uniref:ABC transporter permease n=1 Tax=Halovivax sp. TaxID=1935978 RepID=UPI0025C59B2C|nr:ABC transporter permease [Halovivax sp.]